MAQYGDQIKLYLGQAAMDLQMARDLLIKGEYGAAAASAAESARQTGVALLLDEGIEPGSHGDVITPIQQIFVHGRRLTQEQGEKLSWLFQLGDPPEAGMGSAPALIPGESQKAVEFAESFFEAAKVIIEA